MADDQHVPTQDESDGDGRGEPVGAGAAGDETRTLQPAADDRWRGRAGVPAYPPPQYPPPYEYAPEDEYAPREYADGGRRGWARLGIALVVLLLLGVLGVSVWLILRALEPTPPVVVPTSSPSQASPTASSVPTGSPAPTATGPSTVAVPFVVGLPVATAEGILDRAGLRHTVVTQADSDAAPGTVVAVEPAEASLVPVDSTVTLVVAVGRPAPPTSPPSSAGPTARRSG